MLLLDLPLLMVIAFLLLTIVLAFYFTKRITSFREYAVGNKRFPTATLVGTALATAWGGGGWVRNVALIHQYGLYEIIYFFISLGGNCWILIQLVLRMRPFMHHLSIAETIGSIYGRYPRIITALLSTATSIAVIAIQIKVMSFAITSCLSLHGVHLRTITIFATVILIVYATIGGVRVITFTDIVQIGAFSIVLPMLAWWLFIQIDKPIEEVVTSLHAQEKYQLASILRLDITLLRLIMSILSGAFFLIPAMIQRIYMASSCFQASKVFRNAGIVDFFMTCLVVLVGLFVSVAKPTLLETEVWPYIIAHIPPILKGSLAIGLIALAMSTADSFLNTCTVLVSHDILQSINSTKTISIARKLWLAKVTSIIVGLLAMMLSFYYNDLLQLVSLGVSLYLPIITAPFILAVFGFRGSTHTALLGMATGALAMVAWNRWVMPKTDIAGDFICMLANGLVMMATHYLWPPSTDKRCQVNQIKITSVKKFYKK